MLLPIRHHGPGSAASLLKALEAYQPDILLLEAPADAESTLLKATQGNLTPPVALLAYNPKQHTQAAFYPFASFSPEWQAIHWCHQQGTHLRCFDLPTSIRFTLPDSIEETLAQQPPSLEGRGRGWGRSPETEQPLTDEPHSSLNTHNASLHKDPIAYLAHLDGYTDSERWWEARLENHPGHADAFVTILNMMTALREGINRPESEETLLREAFMRETIRQTREQGYQRIAIVCGAWHAPVLVDIDRYKKEDKARLKGLKKTPIETTWIPWTYERLSFNSGYGAGVLSPAWYELLFTTPHHEVVSHWMVRAARLLREQDFDASSAHAIEAVRLASALAALRGHLLPGIEELVEAAVTIFGGGHPERLEVVRQKLVIGEVLGEVGEGHAATPLQQDLQAEQKRLKLKPEAAQKLLELDLRQDLHLERSHLLHRLRLLSINWAEPQRPQGRSQGTFKEHWRLQWRPELALSVVEAGLWGNTLAEAALNYTNRQAIEATSLEELSHLIEEALQANLSTAIPALAARLSAASASVHDVTHLLAILPPLAQVLRYGNVRRTDAEPVAQVVHTLVPRICISLPAACTGLDHDAAQALLTQVQAAHRALHLLQNEDHLQAWNAALQTISQADASSGLLAGAATRNLFDSHHLTPDETGLRLGLALSPARETARATDWVEGFLGESGLLLIHNPELFGLIDAWVMQLPEDTFRETVPLLRRTFARFPLPERGQLLRLVTSPGICPTASHAGYDEERSRQVLPILRMLLGAEEPQTA